MLQVFRRTLTIVEGSKLAIKFSGRWDHCLERDDRGNIFVDQDERIFVPLVNFLRAKVNEAQSSSLSSSPRTPSSSRFPKAPLSIRDFDNDPTLYRDYLRMLDAYGLYELLYHVRIQHLPCSSSPPPPLPNPSNGTTATTTTITGYDDAVDVDDDDDDESAAMWPDVFDPSGVDFRTERPHYFALEMVQENNDECITSFELQGTSPHSTEGPNRTCQILVGWMKVDVDSERNQHDDNTPTPTTTRVVAATVNYFPIKEWWPGSGNVMSGSRIKSHGVFYVVDNFSSEWSIKCSWDRVSGTVRVYGSYGTQATMDFPGDKVGGGGGGGGGRPVFGGVGHWKLSAVKTTRMEKNGPYV